MDLRVSASVAIGRYGVAVFFEEPPTNLVLGQMLQVLVRQPGGGSEREESAVVEAARLVPPGEVIAFSFRACTPADIPVGSTISWPTT
jgi:hypothetical protein